MRGHHHSARQARLRKRIWAHLFVVLVVGIFASGVVFTTGWRTAFIHSTGARLARHVAAQLARDWYRARAARSHDAPRLRGARPRSDGARHRRARARRRRHRVSAARRARSRRAAARADRDASRRRASSSRRPSSSTAWCAASSSRRRSIAAFRMPSLWRPACAHRGHHGHRRRRLGAAGAAHLAAHRAADRGSAPLRRGRPVGARAGAARHVALSRAPPRRPTSSSS